MVYVRHLVGEHVSTFFPACQGRLKIRRDPIPFFRW